MDALAQFRNIPKEPQLWETENIENDNKSYQAETGDLDLAKKQLKESLWYWKIVEKNNNWKEQLENINKIIEKEEQQRKIKEHPNTPLIERFVSQWLLTPEEWNLVKVSVVWWNNIKKDIFNIDWLDSNKKNQIIDAIQFLDNGENKKECIKNFNSDFADKIDWLKQIVDWSKEWKKELIWRNKDLVEMLGSNYFSLEIQEWKKDTKNESLDEAFKTTLNQLMFDKSFIRPNTFDSMLNTVNNSKLSFLERFNELKNIDNLIINDQSRANWKQANAFRKTKKWTEKQSLSLEKTFNELKQKIEIAKQDNNIKILKQLWEEVKELKEEEDNSWDIFIVSELDKLWEQINELLKEA